MSTDDLFSAAAQDEKTRRTNVPEMSVSELALSLKRTLEDTYGRVRVRGELTGVKLAASGHLYGDLKDADACINIVCWKGTMPRLSVRPEDGLDVVITGKMTSFPKNSRYQLVIESMELAGEGALLKMLEDRRKRLAAEGLFDPARKKPLPFLPEVIGVVTSPTGAVIRDIIHRVSERFPRRLLLWPVAVQGQDAASQIAAAIRGFNALTPSGNVPRPDLLIVARGGGSLEDLMAFNEEIVVRAAADSGIPLISAVGHETDTTLIDFAADLRAPTPTGAAERAVPVRLNLLAQVMDDAMRMTAAADRILQDKNNRRTMLSARLGDPFRIIEVKTQSVDILGANIVRFYEKMLSQKGQILSRMIPARPGSVLSDKKLDLERRTARLGQAYDKILNQRGQKLAQLRPQSPDRLVEQKARDLARAATLLPAARMTYLNHAEKTLEAKGRMLDNLSFHKILARGYAVIRRDDGMLLSSLEAARSEEAMEIQFRDGSINVQKR